MLKAPWYINVVRMLVVLIVFFLVIMALYPMFWMIITSFKTYSESLTWPPSVFPRKFILSNYQLVFSTPNFFRYFLNSCIYAIGGTFLAVLFSSMGGYGFAKYKFKGQHVLFVIILATMMVPGQVTLIPVFLICKLFGWIDTYLGLIIPGLAGAFGLFMIRQFAMGVPNDFFEAARIDGAGEFRIYTTVFIPLILPALTTLVVLDFMARWNDLFWPLIILNSNKMRTMQLALTTLFRTLQDTRWSELCAALTIAAMPVLILYSSFQKYFTRGIVLTSGVKG